MTDDAAKKLAEILQYNKDQVGKPNKSARPGDTVKVTLGKNSGVINAIAGTTIKSGGDIAVVKTPDGPVAIQGQLGGSLGTQSVINEVWEEAENKKPKSRGISDFICVLGADRPVKNRAMPSNIAANSESIGNIIVVNSSGKVLIEDFNIYGLTQYAREDTYKPLNTLSGFSGGSDFFVESRPRVDILDKNVYVLYGIRDETLGPLLSASNFTGLFKVKYFINKKATILDLPLALQISSNIPGFGLEQKLYIYSSQLAMTRESINLFNPDIYSGGFGCLHNPGMPATLITKGSLLDTDASFNSFDSGLGFTYNLAGNKETDNFSIDYISTKNYTVSSIDTIDYNYNNTLIKLSNIDSSIVVETEGSGSFTETLFANDSRVFNGDLLYKLNNKRIYPQNMAVPDYIEIDEQSSSSSISSLGEFIKNEGVGEEETLSVTLTIKEKQHFFLSAFNKTQVDFTILNINASLPERLTLFSFLVPTTQELLYGKAIISNSSINLIESNITDFYKYAGTITLTITKKNTKLEENAGSIYYYNYLVLACNTGITLQYLAYSYGIRSFSTRVVNETHPTWFSASVSITYPGGIETTTVSGENFIECYYSFRSTAPANNFWGVFMDTTIEKSKNKKIYISPRIRVVSWQSKENYLQKLTKLKNCLEKGKFLWYEFDVIEDADLGESNGMCIPSDVKIITSKSPLNKAIEFVTSVEDEYDLVLQEDRKSITMYDMDFSSKGLKNAT